MAKTYYRRKPVWPFSKELIGFLSASREQTHSRALNTSLNQSIIFYSACYVEGCLEAGLKSLLEHRQAVYNSFSIGDFETRRTTNRLFRSLREDVHARIARATGIGTFDELFGLVIRQRLSEQTEVQEEWEAITVLFQFRNVLAHGREISASRVYKHDEPTRDDFSGGYKKAEDYLLKKNFIDKRFLDGADCECLFKDDIADHFSEIARAFVTKISEGLEEKDREVYVKVLGLE